MTLGSRIKEYRRKRGFTQSQMADKLNMTEANFSSYERDKSIPPSEKLFQIASILNVSTDYLLGRTEKSENLASGSEVIAEASEPYYTLTEKDNRDVAKRLQAMMDELESDSALAFMGEPMDEEDRELMRISLDNALRMSKQMAKKKFTPKKYRE